MRKNKFIIDGEIINHNDNITIYDFGIKLGTNIDGKIILVDPLNNFFKFIFKLIKCFIILFINYQLSIKSNLFPQFLMNYIKLEYF